MLTYVTISSSKCKFVAFIYFIYIQLIGARKNMPTREKKFVTVTCAKKESLTFELAKLKHRIQANSSLISQNNLFIFTKECNLSA